MEEVHQQPDTESCAQKVTEIVHSLDSQRLTTPPREVRGRSLGAGKYVWRAGLSYCEIYLNSAGGSSPQNYN